MTVRYEDLKDRNVLVTGGASGLGYAIARSFAENQCNVVIVGRDKEKLSLARKELGTKATSLSFDLSRIDQLPDLMRQVKNAVGEIDILVNSAGVNQKKEALTVSDEEYEKVIRTNQTAVFAITREAAKPMIRRRSGNIVMISSMASQYGLPKVISYTASKAAIEGMTRALAVEWSPFGVRVNCIAPGFIVTAMSSKALDNDPERKRRVLARTPMGSLGEPADVANAALFLASSQSKYITGVVLPVDGGNSIGF